MNALHPNETSANSPHWTAPPCDRTCTCPLCERPCLYCGRATMADRLILPDAVDVRIAPHVNAHVQLPEHEMVFCDAHCAQKWMEVAIDNHLLLCLEDAQ
jgi:hypothetical protein